MQPLYAFPKVYRPFFVCFSICCSPLTLSAQADDQNAVRITTIDGTTITGTIAGFDPAAKNEVVEIYLDGTDKSQPIPLNELAMLEFTYYGLQYAPVSYVNFNQDGKKITETRLGRRIVDGPASLFKVQFSGDYFPKDKSVVDDLIYLIKKENNWLKLQSRKKFYDGVSLAFDEEPMYQEVLRFLFTDVGVSKLGIDKIDYTDRALGKVINQYNSIVSVEKYKNNYGKKPPLKSYYVLSGDVSPVTLASDYQSSLGFKLGASYMLTNNWRSSGLSFGLGLFYSNVPFTEVKPYFDGFVNSTIELEGSYNNLKVLAVASQVIGSGGKIKPQAFVRGGINRMTINRFVSIGQNEVRPDLIVERSEELFAPTVEVGLGLGFKNYTLQIHTVGNFSNGDLDILNFPVYLGMQYLLVKK